MYVTSVITTDACLVCGLSGAIATVHYNRDDHVTHTTVHRFGVTQTISMKTPSLIQQFSAVLKLYYRIVIYHMNNV